MSNVLLIRFVCFAEFLLRLFNFCLLYLFIHSFPATILDGEIKAVYIKDTERRRH